jgi:hypothetical protein
VTDVCVINQAVVKKTKICDLHRGSLRSRTHILLTSFSTHTHYNISLSSRSSSENGAEGIFLSLARAAAAPEQLADKICFHLSQRDTFTKLSYHSAAAKQRSTPRTHASVDGRQRALHCKSSCGKRV